MAKKPQEGLAERLLQPTPSPYANRCSVGRLLSDANADEREAISNALAKVKESIEKNTFLQTGYSAKWLAKVLQEYGYKISDRMIRRHIHRSCSCES